ncbi:hypothetical protein X975_14783, partial [Stegodyphus mimosarum]
MIAGNAVSSFAGFFVSFFVLLFFLYLPAAILHVKNVYLT